MKKCAAILANPIDTIRWTLLIALCIFQAVTVFRMCCDLIDGVEFLLREGVMGLLYWILY